MSDSFGDDDDGIDGGGDGPDDSLFDPDYYDALQANRQDPRRHNLHDGFERVEADAVIAATDEGAEPPVDLPAIQVMRGSVINQLHEALVVHEQANAAEILSATHYGNDPESFPAVAAIHMDPDDGRMRINTDQLTPQLEGAPETTRDLVSLSVTEITPNTKQPGMHHLILQVIDEDLDTWRIRLETPPRQLLETTTALRALAKMHRMVTAQPTQWASHAADTDDFLALDGANVAGVRIKPSDEGPGWSMVVEHDDYSGQTYRFEQAGQAIDAMQEVLEALGRPVTALDVGYIDPDTGAEETETLAADKLGSQLDQLELPVAEQFSIKAVVGSKRDMPNVVGGVVLANDWLAYRRGQASDMIKDATAITERMLYPVGRADPHPYDVSTGPQADSADQQDGPPTPR
ncbi:MAG: hypothetical protein AAF213_10845, partial [Pseudomonadota bacterium]